MKKTVKKTASAASKTPAPNVVAVKPSASKAAPKAASKPTISTPPNPTELLAAIKRGPMGKDADYRRYAERLFD
ncbi:MAG TPA: hypothetical protein VGT79_00290, partial [Xanthomonadaceae bacterium]|nr:hypothetical protein [Xanthomonadaceae bacterium]